MLYTYWMPLARDNGITSQEALMCLATRCSGLKESAARDVRIKDVRLSEIRQSI